MRFTYIVAIVIMLSFFYFFASCIKEVSEDVADEVLNHVEAGDPLPVFSVSDGAGNVLTNEDFKGKKSYLIFFVTTCPDCARELPKMERIWSQLKDDPAYQVVAIARKQGKEETDAYWKEKNFTMPKYLDPDRTVYNMFANVTVPRIYLVDSKGIVQWMAIEEITLSDGELLEQITSLP